MSATSRPDDAAALSDYERSKLMQGIWPVVVFQDRYRGTYTGGEWLAVPSADGFDPEATVWADDEACFDWAARATGPDGHVGVGGTPDEALEDLVRRAHTGLDGRRKGDVSDDDRLRAERLQAAIERHRAQVMADPSRSAEAEDELWSHLGDVAG